VASQVFCPDALLSSARMTAFSLHVHLDNSHFHVHSPQGRGLTSAEFGLFN
jgi:hypothetical protein